MSFKQGFFLFFSGFAVLIALTVIGGCYYTVDSGYRGVILRNGRIIGMADPGLGFKTPWIEAVYEYSIATNTLKWAGDSKIQAYSKDQQPADIVASVNWAIDPDQVGCIYSHYGTNRDALISTIIAPRVLNNVKNVFGTYDAQSAINDGAKLTAEIAGAVESAVNSVQPCGKPVVTVSGFNLENIDFSDAYEKSVEDRMVAQINVAKAQQDADRAKAQADQAFNEADGRARSVEREASAEAKAIQMRGDAEAEVIVKKGQALKDNPGVAQLTIAQRWNGELPKSMIPGGTVPLMSITPPGAEDIVKH
jgi:Membrane protease subunits, stomatin/prohibitin homologs